MHELWPWLLLWLAKDLSSVDRTAADQHKKVDMSSPSILVQSATYRQHIKAAKRAKQSKREEGLPGPR
jgi:hypothetical protein